jgi:hypothetical protein
MHLGEGVLRRSIDEPESLDAAGSTHLGACAACRDRRSELERNASFAERLIAESSPVFDAHSRVARVAQPRLRRPTWIAPAIAIAAAAGIVLALAFTPLGGVAAQWLTIFEPKQFVPLEISAKDSEQLRLVPSLQRLGTFIGAKPPPRRRVTSLSGIGNTLGFEPRSIGAASRDRQPGAAFVEMPFSTSFTFSAAKARAYEAKFKRSLPPMPGGLDGTTYTATYGPTLVRTFGQGADRVAFVESKTPRLSSTGASLETAANYILSLPNVPPGVAAQLRAIADPAHTLPIPFVFDKATATPVTVDGVSGLAIGDETKFGSGVLWSKDGVVYVVAGPMRESEAIALANSVK